MKMNVSTWVLCKHMPMDQQPSVYSHITEQRHVKRSYDGIVANGSDAPFCERPHSWLDPTKLEIMFRVAEARAGEHGLQWSVGSRLIGFEKDRNSLGETPPRTCWVMCDSVPVCVAVDRLRPCMSRNFWLDATCKPKVDYLSRQTLRHNKASSRNVPPINPTVGC